MIKRYIPIGLLILAVLPFGAGKTYAREIDPESIVATVNGKPISYKSTKFKKSVADRIFEHKHSRAPQNQDDFKKIKQIQQKKEIENLTFEIRNIIHDEIRLKNHITVSSQELKDKWEEMFQGKDFEKQMIETRRFYTSVFLAAESVFKKKMTAEKAYQKYLKKNKGIRSIEEWKKFLRQFNSPEHFASFKNFLNMTAKEQAEASYPSMEGYVVQDKLNRIIDKELTATDLEFSELHSIQEKIRKFKKKYKKLNRSVPFGTDLMDQKRGKWWRARYREADIKILKPEFSLAKKYLLGDQSTIKYIQEIP